MLEINKINKWYNYKIRYEIKENKQLLIFMNDELAYKSKKNCFKEEEIKGHKIKLNKWFIPRYVQYDKTILVWNNDKEKNKFINFCKLFKYKTCYQLQDELNMKLNYL